MIDLYQIANEIRILLEERRKELNLYFIEDNHKYFMNNEQGQSKSNWPSVSKVLKSFYPPFPTQEASLKKAKGDVVLQKKLIKEWSQMADYANNTGSRVHYFLEKKIIERFELDKEVREPEFDCDFEQIVTSDHMISYGVQFYEKMIKNGAVLIDTEVVMGDPDLGYTGQADKIWLVSNKERTQLGIVVTDWKTNRPKNFVETKWTIRMNEPYQDLPNTALGHYYVQLSLYGKLFQKMLKGTKYEGLPIVRATLILLKDSCYEEYKTPIDVINRTLELDILDYIL
jgi:hypothetical protein